MAAKEAAEAARARLRCVHETYTGTALNFLNPSGASEEQPAQLFALYTGGQVCAPGAADELPRTPALRAEPPASRGTPSPTAGGPYGRVASAPAFAPPSRPQSAPPPPSPPLRTRLLASPYLQPTPKSPYALPPISGHADGYAFSPAAAPPRPTSAARAYSAFSPAAAPPRPTSAARAYSAFSPAPAPPRPTSAAGNQPPRLRSASAARLTIPPRGGHGAAGGVLLSTAEGLQRDIRQSVSGLCSAVNRHAERLHSALEGLHSGASMGGHMGGGAAAHGPPHSPQDASGGARRLAVRSGSAAGRASSPDSKAARAREMAEQLASSLRANAARVRGLFLRPRGEDVARRVSRQEFHHAIKVLGFEASRAAIDACFDGWVAAAVPATGVAASVGGGDGISDEIGLRELLLRLQVSNDKGTRPRRVEGGVISRNVSTWSC